MKKRTKQSGCGDLNGGSRMSLAAIVRHYGMESRQTGHDELERFRKHRQMRSLHDAIENAAHSEDAEGKRHPHQRRLTEVAIAEATSVLLESASRIRRCSNFDELLAVVEAVLSDTSGVGELYKYDVSLRIGAWLGYMPKKVYLHSGTRVGAKALGLDTAEASVETAALPKELRGLPPAEVEDILCIYKDRFRSQ